MSAGVRVLIVADDPLTRAGLAALLTGQDGCTVAGQTASVEPAPGNRQELAPAAAVPLAISAYRPDVLLWDLGWDSPGHAGAHGRTGQQQPPDRRADAR